jgi:hypothetical protein
LTWSHKKYTYQVGRPNCNPWGQCYYNFILLFWWTPHWKIKVNPKPNLISSTSLVSSPLVELLCLFVNDGRSFYMCYFGHVDEKHKSYKSLIYIVYMLNRSGLTFEV